MSTAPDGWRAAAACRGCDPELFFPERGQSGAEAVAVCGVCTVVAECLDYALKAGERIGVWGGLSERQRKRLRPKRTHVAVCGTSAGYDAHRNRGEDACDACRRARAEAVRMWNQRRKSA